MSEWISVKERLPEQGRPILICASMTVDLTYSKKHVNFTKTTAKEIFIGFCYEANGETSWYFKDFDGDYTPIKVTHWMEMPDFPEE